MEGVRFLCTVLVHKRFFLQGETVSFPWKTEFHQLHLNFSDLTTCVILDTLNDRKCKGSGILSGMKVPAQSFKAYLDLPRFFHANPGLPSEDLILTWNTTTSNNSLKHQATWGQPRHERSSPIPIYSKLPSLHPPRYSKFPLNLSLQYPPIPIGYELFFVWC